MSPPAGMGCIAVSTGTATPQASTAPKSIASPPVMPTR
jgi:hypothetical protein